MPTDSVSIHAAPTPHPDSLTDEQLEAIAREGNAPATSLYDRLVTQIATLECVLSTLSEWDLAGQPTGRDCHINSAELVLRESISALHDIAGNINGIESPVAQAVHS